jgi:large subunit ribosomal protein L24
MIKKGYKTSLKKNDTVIVLSGDDKGKKGRILKLVLKTTRKGNTRIMAVIEGVNFIKKHSKPNKQAQQGGIVSKEAPITAAKLMLICPRCNRPSKTGIKILRDGVKSRSCKKCGETIE